LLNKNQIRYFKDIAGFDEGLFICGPYPHWLMLTSRGELRTHPMGIDASIPCFAPFHNVNCQKGFIYFNRKVIFLFLPASRDAGNRITHVTINIGDHL
jgi:hypothetical protein